MTLLLQAEQVVLQTPAGPVPILVRVSPRARRLSIRFVLAEDRFELVLPRRISERAARAFLEAHAGWVAARLNAAPPRVLFVPGARVPVLGLPRELVWVGGRGLPVTLAEGRIEVSGRAEHLARRVTDYLKAQARQEVSQRVRAMAPTLERPVGRITLRDTRSRWGSCSSKGDLAFSWRLILAPERVLTYVVAHELAHLVEFDHGPRFWRLVDRLCPDARPAKAWLKRHGAELLRYG